MPLDRKSVVEGKGADLGGRRTIKKKVNVAAPATAVIVGAPPQPFTTFGTAETATPAGSASLKVRPLRAGEPAGLVTVNVSVELCPTPTVDGANALVSAGSDCTVRPELVTLLAMRASALMLP